MTSRCGQLKVASVIIQVLNGQKPCYTAIPKITISQTCYDLF